MKKSLGLKTRGAAGRFAAAFALGLTLLPPGAGAQTTQPPKPEDFKAMQTPGAPAELAPVPGAGQPGANLLTSPNGPAAVQPGFTGSRMVMTQAVWQSYVRYLQEDVSTGFGFFMVTVDGLMSDVKQCQSYSCQISPVSQSMALTDCQAKNRNRRCIVFAEGRSIKYAYQVVQ